MARPVRREAVGAPDALNGADRNAGGFRHHRPGPVRRLQGRVFKRQGDNPFGDLVPQRRDAGRARLVAKQAVEAVLHEPFCQRQTQVLDLAVRRMISFVSIPSAEQRWRGVAIDDESPKTAAINRRNGNGNASAHPTHSHDASQAGNPIQDSN